MRQKVNGNERVKFSTIKREKKISRPEIDFDFLGKLSKKFYFIFNPPPLLDRLYELL